MKHGTVEYADSQLQLFAAANIDHLHNEYDCEGAGNKAIKEGVIYEM